MKKLFDLRFVIGIFFTVIGILLTIYDLVKHENTIIDTPVNIWSAAMFLLFGISMIALSFLKKLSGD